MKKGQSEIIVVVLLVLLVISAVVIVWNVVNRTVEKGSETIAETSFDYSAKLEYNIVSKDLVNVSVRRGTDSKNISGIILVVKTAGGQEKFEIYENLPQSVDTKTYQIDLRDSSINSSQDITEIGVYFAYEKDGQNLTTGILNTKSIRTPETIAECVQNSDCPVRECYSANCSSGNCVYNVSRWADCGINGTCNSTGGCVNYTYSNLVYDSYYMNYNMGGTNIEYFYFSQVGINTNNASWLNKWVRFYGTNCIINISTCVNLTMVNTNSGCWNSSNNCLGIDSSKKVLKNETKFCSPDKFYIYMNASDCARAVA